MAIRIFSGRNMREVLNKIKEEIGEHAQIVDNDSVSGMVRLYVSEPEKLSMSGSAAPAFRVNEGQVLRSEQQQVVVPTQAPPQQDDKEAIYLQRLQALEQKLQKVEQTVVEPKATAVKKRSLDHSIPLANTLLELGVSSQWIKKMCQGLQHYTASRQLGIFRQRLFSTTHCAAFNHKAPIQILIGPPGAGKSLAMSNYSALLKQKGIRSKHIYVGAVANANSNSQQRMLDMGDQAGLYREIRQRQGAEVCLLEIDSSVSDPKQISGMLKLLKHAEVHLCLPTSASAQWGLKVAADYRAWPIHGVGFTQCDLSHADIHLVALAQQMQMPIQWLSYGQRGLRLPEPEQLLARCMQQLTRIIAGKDIQVGAKLGQGKVSSQKRPILNNATRIRNKAASSAMELGI